MSLFHSGTLMNTGDFRFCAFRWGVVRRWDILGT